MIETCESGVKFATEAGTPTPDKVHRNPQSMITSDMASVMESEQQRSSLKMMKEPTQTFGGDLNLR